MLSLHVKPRQKRALRCSPGYDSVHSILAQELTPLQCGRAVHCTPFQLAQASTPLKTDLDNGSLTSAILRVVAAQLRPALTYTDS